MYLFINNVYLCMPQIYSWKQSNTCRVLVTADIQFTTTKYNKISICQNIQLVDRLPYLISIINHCSWHCRYQYLWIFYCVQNPTFAFLRNWQSCDLQVYDFSEKLKPIIWEICNQYVLIKDIQIQEYCGVIFPFGEGHYLKAPIPVSGLLLKTVKLEVDLLMPTYKEPWDREDIRAQFATKV